MPNGPAADWGEGGLALGVGVAVGTNLPRTGDDDGDGEGVGAAVGGIVELGALAAGRGGGAQICCFVRVGSVWPVRSV
ncbi:MAG TPA: hypothetical protein VE258_02705 [Ktedonobacterales bacterium]|nr:hypothetical protein [Ktedonobacterales bacterium]